ncbi:hypothetical protein CSKR_203281 [Clonorchis sinensis]|uniref:Uncharacterized protein n=1 Tax=Clonorchis sinensis TaxID=79923 RepID=A0A8T1MAE7_CLOSI|nr:hypothetical protein CSKR_203281 [Clonorchis sinensis]
MCDLNSVSLYQCLLSKTPIILAVCFPLVICIRPFISSISVYRCIADRLRLISFGAVFHPLSIPPQYRLRPNPFLHHDTLHLEPSLVWLLFVDRTRLLRYMY